MLNNWRNSRMAFWQPCCAGWLSRTLSCSRSHACTDGSPRTRREAWRDCQWDWRTDAPPPPRRGQRIQRSPGCLLWHDMWWHHCCRRAEDQPLPTHSDQFWGGWGWVVIDWIPPSSLSKSWCTPKRKNPHTYTLRCTNTHTFTRTQTHTHTHTHINSHKPWRHPYSITA